MTETTDFQQTLGQLETLVKKLEQPGLKLEESIKVYEQAMVLLAECQASLAQAKQRVELVQRHNDEIVTTKQQQDL